MSSPPPSPPPPPPPTTQSSTPPPVPPSVGPHDSDPPPTPTPTPPGIPAPAPAAEGAESTTAPAPAPPGPEAGGPGSAPASPGGPVPPSAPEGADSNHLEEIPRPANKEERQPGFPYDLLGIGKYKADRDPLRARVREVYREQTSWSTSKKTYQELPREETSAAEQKLQSELEKLYPGTSYTGGQVRACRAWLPGVLLGRKHKDRRNTWAQRRGAA